MLFTCCTEKLIVYNGKHHSFASFVDGEFETEDRSWIPVLKKVQGVKLEDENSVIETDDTVFHEPVKKSRGRPPKVVKK